VGITAGDAYQAGDVIKPGGKYGVVMTKKNNTDHTVDLSLWFQDFSRDAAPRNIINVNDHGQFGHKPFTGDSFGDPVTAGIKVIDIRRDYAQGLKSITDIKQFSL
jgi:hypothetical protein